MSSPTSPDIDALHWRRLQPHDLDAMHALHLHSIEGMAVQTVKPETRDFLASLLGGRGRVLGGWTGAALVAYGVLQHDLLADDAPRALLGLPEGAPLCKLAGAAVHRAWRGHGLQRLLIQRLLELAGASSVLAPSAPGNPASWRSLLACGLSVRAVQYRYGGHARYLLARVPGELFRADESQALELGPQALERQQHLLAQGWRGVAAGRQDGHLRLLPGCAKDS